jgi:hypothetical protein
MPAILVNLGGHPAPANGGRLKTGQSESSQDVTQAE